MTSVIKPFEVHQEIHQSKQFFIPLIDNKWSNIKHCTKERYISKSDIKSLPDIDIKFLNLSNIHQFNNDQRSNRFTNQSNSITGIVSEAPDDSKDEEEDVRSKVYIKNQTNNEIYLLEFTATDILLIPVYLKHRTFEENKNDKCMQPRSSTIFEHHYNKKARRFYQLLKTFKIDKPKIDEELSAMSFKKPLFKKRETVPPLPKKKKSVSDPGSNLKDSLIILRYKNVEYRIHPGLMKMRYSNVIDLENERRKQKLLKDLNMPSTGDVKNKATLVVNYKGDILKFIFGLNHINCSKVKITSSIGVMAKDDNIYVREFSTISNRTIYIAVPKTNYEYTDPMIKEKHVNRSLIFHKIEPRWLVKQRKKRNKEYYQCRRKNPYDDLMDLKIGSSLCYEGFNCINKVNGGTLHCSVVSDKEYEKWVESIERAVLPQIDTDSDKKYDAVFSGGVPDWDLVIHSK